MFVLTGTRSVVLAQYMYVWYLWKSYTHNVDLTLQMREPKSSYTDSGRNNVTFYFLGM